MSDKPHLLSIEEIPGGQSEVESIVDLLAQHVELTPRALSLLSLCECREQLERRGSKPLRLVMAAKSAHLALQAALIDALAGSASIGAFPEAERAKWLAYFNARDDEASPPTSDFVMHFNNLLDRAMTHPLEWLGRPLEITTDQQESLKRLTFIRNRVEHVRPGSLFVEPKVITLSLPIAAHLSLDLLDVCWHHYEDGERAAAEADVLAISRICADIDL